MSFMAKPLTEEEIDINAAMDDHIEAMHDALKAMKAAILLHISGFACLLIGDQDSQLSRIGFALFLTGSVCFLAHIFLMFREQKKRKVAMELVMAYKRKHALPFFNELTELFANKSGVHIHLEEDGMITIRDKRKEDKSDV